MANELIQNGIVPRKYFYPLTSDFTIIKEKFVVQDTPIAGKIADEDFDTSIICRLIRGRSRSDL